LIFVANTSVKVIEELYDHLKDDYTSLKPRYPKSAIQAGRDKRVIEALKKRFENNQVLIDIRSLEFSYSTGLDHVYFEFEPKPPIALDRDTFLVLIDQYSNVVGIVDPYDPNQPNKFFPPLGKLQRTCGGLPFVLDRPSVTEGPATDERGITDLYSKEFYNRVLEWQKSMSSEIRDKKGKIYLRCGEEEHSGHASASWHYTRDPIAGTPLDCPNDRCDIAEVILGDVIGEDLIDPIPKWPI
jgi:hypothetical protein